MQFDKEGDVSNKISVLDGKDHKTQRGYRISEDGEKKLSFWNPMVSATTERKFAAFSHYISLLTLGLIIWGLLWTAFGDSWQWNGPWFRIAIVAVVAWSSGLVLEATTSLPPLLAALLTGILARHLEVLDMRDFTHIDAFFRKIYPVLILGKGSLGWDVYYMKKHWKQVLALGVLPWSTEVLVMSICTRFLLGFPWIWGILLGAVYASVSCPVIMPSVMKIGSRAGRDWPQLVCTAGGTDTALSVGVYGLILTYIFTDTSNEAYRYAKAVLAIFVGIVVGVAWGCVSGLVPHSRDRYVTELRVLFVLLGGLFVNFVTSHIGWGGTGGVAVLACNATASTFWKRDGWKLNNNAASTAYRVLWSTAEPLLFAYTGTYFTMKPATGETLLKGLLILLICLTLRLAVAFLVCWDMNLKERIFVCCVWTPKSVVEAVLCPVAINAALIFKASEKEKSYAEDVLRLLVEAIFITTPIGFLLTRYLGPWLLAVNADDAETVRGRDMQRKKSNSSEVTTHRQKTESRISDGSRN